MDPTTTNTILTTAEGLVLSYVKGSVPFLPLIDQVMGIIKAHVAATGTWPTADQVHADFSTDVAKLAADIAAVKLSGDGTLPKP